MKSAGAVLVAPRSVRSGAAAPIPVTYVDVAAAAGITFRHDNAASAEKYLIETMGAGCGWIDYDQNGLLDLYLVNGAATRLYTPQAGLRSALYRNNGDGTFTDVTRKRAWARKDCLAWAWPSATTTTTDFPICSFSAMGRCILYHNNGDGTFADVTTKAGVDNEASGDRAQPGLITTTTAGWIS